MNIYRAGIDIGSTTVKLVIIDENDKIVYAEYLRHCAQTQQTLSKLISDAVKKLGDCMLKVSITGSGAINLAKAMDIDFIQEVVAVASAIKKNHPRTDVAIELGGEDAKIIYFKGGLDERMNGVCAGGTGSFIDQMAALLQTDAEGLNKEAANYKEIYPIAARCGVFAKTDIQPLINEGATKPDLAASIFQAVVNQTISGLACGKPIRGCVAFLGGPLHFLSELKKAFIRTLNLSKENAVDPENSHLFAALGAALNSDKSKTHRLSELENRLKNGIKLDFELKRLDPLFENEEQYHKFKERHNKSIVKKQTLESYEGKCFLGIDAGSTTTKLALIGEEGQLLYSFYSNNNASPVRTAIDAIAELKNHMPKNAVIARSCSTGYGEQLLKSAFCLDEGEVETIAHCTAASFFDEDVDCVLDIGGQDMKCIKLKEGSVDTILLNEACSSGCGSFIENFAGSLGYTAQEFANKALFAKNPIDLGTRCTVFMNSNVKQAQKEGAGVEDISAGLAYSVIKNALYKVIKLADAKELGEHIVVQGGTFYNHAVLRAFEKIAGTEATCPDISGIMGAFGAALIAKNRYVGQESSMMSLEEITALTYTTKAARCSGCENRCMLTVNTFPGMRKHITGNRCEKGAGGKYKAEAPNMVSYKLRRIFGYEPLKRAKRGKIGIPRVLNIYENYPYWHTFFTELGFEVVLSPMSDRRIYELGIESIPSESECYPAKLSHGHVQWLINNGIDTIFHPCVFYEHKEVGSAQNHFNCPIVISYPENLKNNIEDISDGKVKYIRPFMAFTDCRTASDRLVSVCKKVWGIEAAEVRRAAKAAWKEQLNARNDIKKEGKRILDWISKNGKRGIVLAGRPYHMDAEINHGIPELIASYGLAVLTEDSLPYETNTVQKLRVNDQWVYHSRLYRAAEFVCKREDLEIVQLNSFGCGLDAVTTDQVCEILEKSKKLYTVLKIDEVNNLGAARIRIRSLISAMNMRKELNIKPKYSGKGYERKIFTKRMRDEHYTILAPQMSPIHFDIMGPVFKKHGYELEILSNDNRTAIDTGLKYVNNDACFPSITVVGQIMEAVLSGKYDTNRLAIMMTQTGGCCRASNYVGFIRRSLEKAGLSHIPVISLNANRMETNEGFKISLGLLSDALKAVAYGDLLMRCLYRVRPYETEKGSADRLHKKLRDICILSLTKKGTGLSYKKLCRTIVNEFDTLPTDETVRKPRVGIVGEILVKYMPLANNHLVELLEKEGAEAVVPDLLDFLNYSMYNAQYKHKYYGAKLINAIACRIGIWFMGLVRSPMTSALKKSVRFDVPLHIKKVAALAKPFLSIGNQYGEGWFLTGEMVELIKTGAPNIVCIQPFACLPNHVVGKGVIKALKKAYPESNIVAVDYDPGASEVNQLNRIKLMLSQAKENLKTAAESFNADISAGGKSIEI
ncbi:MAG: 2-hydroxyacyl-CoA dehydratase [Christensenellaceae bacterium]|nr:2-hydroxyacyl-CoA dehydratase [Christensenellaceae bacterium]